MVKSFSSNECKHEWHLARFYENILCTVSIFVCSKCGKIKRFERFSDEEEEELKEVY